jgi:hypothetical protein
MKRLIRDGRVKSADVQRYLGDMQTEIEQLESRLRALRDDSASVTRSSLPVRGPGRPPRNAAAAAPENGRVTRKRRRRRAKLSDEGRKSLQVQGHYLALIRQFPAAAREQYKKISSDRGREAAIKSMKEALGK